MNHLYTKIVIVMWPPVNSFSQVFAIYSQTAMSKQNTDSQIFHCCQDLNHAPSSSPVQTRQRRRLLSGFSFTIGVILLHSHQKFCCTSNHLGTAKAAALRQEYRCPYCFSEASRVLYAHGGHVYTINEKDSYSPQNPSLLFTIVFRQRLLAGSALFRPPF